MSASARDDMLGVTNETTKENVIWAITEWLQQRSGPNDIVFVYFAVHGLGYKNGYDYANDNDAQKKLKNLLDTNGDEDDEVSETTLGFDINENGDPDDWVGIDEELYLTEQSTECETIMDDELRLNFSTLNYGKFIFATTACFGGGLIDDMSAPNRIIMVAANETWEGGPMQGPDWLSPWASHFMDALHGEDVCWNWTPYELIHKGTRINDTDSNEDGHVSILEAWNYAWEHDENRPTHETPWLDDDNNGLPTYKNETDGGTDWGNCTDDGILANNTWLPRRHHYLNVKTRKTSGYEISGVKVWINGSLDYSPAAANLTTGTYNITVETSIYLDGYEYKFSFWEDDSTSNPRMLDYDLDPYCNRTITAYYHIQAGGCPFIYVWNDTDYNDFGVIDIHAQEDVIKEVSISPENVGLSKYKACFRLIEGCEGLNYSHSEIDQVKLYAVIDGSRYLCPLIYANHSEFGNVWLKLLFSDDWKIDVYLLETIDLQFLVPYSNVEEYVFVIEGHNLKKY